jgi:hypothetical protein
MSKIAIDVALFLPEEIENVCIGLNGRGKAYRSLGKTDFIPHLSLALGCVEESVIPKIIEIIKRVSSNFSPLPFTAEGISYNKREDGNRSLMDIKKTPLLQKLHEAILNELITFFNGDASKEMLYKCEKLSKSTKFNLDHYVDSRAFSNYNPHLTLNCYDATYDGFPFSFTTDRIALCQVGQGCTCRKVLFEGVLSGN